MAVDANPATAIESLYDSDQSDLPFAHVQTKIATTNDAELAELIEADGRLRLIRNRSVTLERYMDAVPQLPTRPIVLDAAIDVTLRAMSGSARISPKVVEQLAARFPAMAQAIREAAAAEYSHMVNHGSEASDESTAIQASAARFRTAACGRAASLRPAEASWPGGVWAGVSRP
jgi:hypothetical protein